MEMRIALDTNRYSDFHRGDLSVASVLEQVEAIFIPFPALAELRVGFKGGSKGRENERILQIFLSRRGVSVLYADEETTRFYAEIYHLLRTQGTPIPINDVWIAALCVQHDLTLYARDAHFRNISQLRMI
jgi:predicted nucleic acid-binding protein